MKYILTLLILGQILMAATIQNIQVNETKVPLIFESDTRLPLVTMQFTFTNSGSITDTTKAGLAKFSAKLMNEGTKALGSSAFAEALESKAIHIAASTGVETFVIEVGCLKEELDEALAQFEALLKDPNYTQKSVDKIKTMTLGALSAKENNFDYVAANELKALIFKGTVLAQPSNGTIQSVNSVELSDVKEFLTSHLTRSNLIVVLGGDVDLKSVKPKIAQIIKSLPEGNVEDRKSVV